jgi:hypothetical protein
MPLNIPSEHIPVFECRVTLVETSAGNFQAWLKHPRIFSKLLGTFAAQTLAERYDADPSAADWRRFGRLPGFTNCKPKYRKSDGLFPFVRLHSHSGQQYSMARWVPHLFCRRNIKRPLQCRSGIIFSFKLGDGPEHRQPVPQGLSYRWRDNWFRSMARASARKNLRRMMRFAEVFPEEEIVVSLIRQLSWTQLIENKGCKF